MSDDNKLDSLKYATYGIDYARNDSSITCPVSSFYWEEWSSPKPKCECGTSKVLSENKEKDIWQRHSTWCKIYINKVEVEDEKGKGSDEDTWF